MTTTSTPLTIHQLAAMAAYAVSQGHGDCPVCLGVVNEGESVEDVRVYDQALLTEGYLCRLQDGRMSLLLNADSVPACGEAEQFLFDSEADAFLTFRARFAPADTAHGKGDDFAVIPLSA